MLLCRAYSSLWQCSRKPGQKACHLSSRAVKGIELNKVGRQQPATAMRLILEHSALQGVRYHPTQHSLRLRQPALFALSPKALATARAPSLSPPTDELFCSTTRLMTLPHPTRQALLLPHQTHNLFSPT